MKSAADYHAYKAEVVLNVITFIIFWVMEGQREYIKEIPYSSVLILYWLVIYTIGYFVFNLLYRVKRYDRQEKIADIVDFLPMTKKDRNLSNFLINYRKSINIFIPYIFMYLYGGINEYLRGVLSLNIFIMIITESIRNIFMKNGRMKKKRRAIFICDIIPVVSVLVTVVINLLPVYMGYVKGFGNFYMGVVLGSICFVFMLYTAIKYKKVN